MSRRLPVILQTSQTECGLCAAASLMAYFGREERVVHLRGELAPGRDGLSAGDLVRLLRSRGLEASVFRAPDSSALARLDRPVLLFWEEYHWVVLEKAGREGLTIVDPAYGRRFVARDEADRAFSGVIIEASPGAQFVPRRLPLLAAWRTLPLRAPGMRRPFLLSAGLVIVGYAMTIAVPWVTQQSVDAFASGTPLSIPLLIGGLVAAAATFYLVSLGRSFLMARVIATLGGHLMTRIFERLLHLPFSYFATRPAGELLFRLSSANAVRDLLATRALQVVMDVGTILTLMVYLTIVSPTIALTAAMVLAATGLLLMGTGRAVRARIDGELSASSKSQIMQLDAISAISTVKMAGREARVAGAWRDQYRSVMRATQSRMRLQQGVVGAAVTAVQTFAPATLLALSLGGTATGALTIGEAVAVQAVAAMVFAVLSSLYLAYSEFAQASRAVGRLADITDSEPERTGGAARTDARAPIELRGVGFRYAPNAADALTAISLRIEPGSSTAIVGPSGSGKSTLGALLCTLYPPTVGVMLLGGDDVADLDLEASRALIGYVPQDSVLLNGTVLDNLSLGASDDDPERVMRRCRAMGFLDFVDALPMGYRTIVADLGGNLSGGQRQRLAIARALLADPEILVLDEATSALDAATERRVSAHIAALDCTRIVIAHRESTVRQADSVIVLERGRLVQYGDHDDLVSIPGTYRDLYGPPDEGGPPPSQDHRPTTELQTMGGHR